MPTSVTSLLSQFEADARAAQAAENELRKELAQRIALAERQRAFAFRRTRLVRTLAASIPEEDQEAEPGAIWAAQRKAVAEDLGWTHISDRYGVILEHLKPVADAVRTSVSAPDAPVARVGEELAAFEAWFEADTGKPFYVLFDQYVPEVPVVDF